MAGESTAFWRRIVACKSALVLIAANLVPIWGVMFLHWSVFSVVFLFWLENVAIGIFNVLKMLTVGIIGGAQEAPMGVVGSRVWRAVRLGGALFMAGFFTVHYGGFCFVHGIFVVGMLGGGFQSGGPEKMLMESVANVFSSDLGVAAAILFCSHAFSFVSNFLVRREYTKTTVDSLMIGPYGRIVVLHMAILLGAFISVALKSNAGVLVLLVALKVLLDLRFHLKERESGAVAFLRSNYSGSRGRGSGFRKSARE